MSTIFGPNLDITIELAAIPVPLSEFDALGFYARITKPTGLNDSYVRLQFVNWTGTQLDAIGDARSVVVAGAYFWGEQVITVVDGDAFGFRLDGSTMSAYHRTGGIWTLLFSAEPGYADASDIVNAPELLLAGEVAVYFGSAFEPGSFTGPQYDNFTVAEWSGAPPAFPAPQTAGDDFTGTDGTYLTVNNAWEPYFNLNGGGCTSSILTGSYQYQGGRGVNAEYVFPCGFWAYKFNGAEAPPPPPTLPNACPVDLPIGTPSNPAACPSGILP